MGGNEEFYIVMSGFFIVLLICSIFLLFYNILRKREEKVDETWSRISWLYQKKIELIPSLLDVVKKYARNERDTFESVICASTKAQELVAQIEVTPYSSEKKVEEVFKTEGILNVGFDKIDALKKEYPLLMVDARYLIIQKQLSESEKGIIEARRNYEQFVQKCNSGLKRFPLNMMQSLFVWEDSLSYGEETQKQF